MRNSDSNRAPVDSVLGYAIENFEETVIALIERYTGPITRDLVKVKPSRESNYLSVTVTIAATGEDQLHNIFQDLKKLKSVKMVL